MSNEIYGRDLTPEARTRVQRIALVLAYATCKECERVFDLHKEGDAEEWHYGHDCEV